MQTAFIEVRRANQEFMFRVDYTNVDEARAEYAEISRSNINRVRLHIQEHSPTRQAIPVYSMIGD